MPNVNPLELSLPDQIQYALDQLPEHVRLVRLAYAEQKARARGDTEALAAIAQWRLRQQLRKDDQNPS